MPDDSPRLVTDGNEEDEVWSSFSIQNWSPLTADSGDQNASGQVGFWIHSWASLASNGLISGHTRTWSTLGVKGFHGSVLPVVLDASGQVIWPSDPDTQKHTYGVDGFLSPFSPHDRTDYWDELVVQAVERKHSPVGGGGAQLPVAYQVGQSNRDRLAPAKEVMLDHRMVQRRCGGHAIKQSVSEQRRDRIGRVSHDSERIRRVRSEII